MTNTQLIFSLSIGIVLMATGFALTAGGIADWGLFWTGAIIASLTLASHLREREPPAPLLIPKPLPVTGRIDY